MKGGNVRLNSLPTNEIYLNITDSFMRRLSDERKNRFKNMKELALAINESETTVINFFWMPSAVRLGTFLKLVKLFKIDSYESEITWIGGKTRGKGISNPKLPFKFDTEEGGMFIAAVLGDGAFLHNLEIQYRNYDALMLQRVINTAKNLFGDVDIVWQSETAVTFPRILGRIIYTLGLRPGRKTVTNPSIPKFILNGSKACKIGFLRQISDDDGSPQIRPPYSYSVRYEFAREIPLDKFSEKEKYVPSLLLNLHNLFRSLGYSVTNIYGGRVYKGRKKPRFIISWAFDVQGKLSLERFAREINFRIPKRKEKLEHGLSKMKVETYGRKAQDVALRRFYEISQKIGYVTKHELMKQMKRTERNAQEWLSKLEKRGLTKRIGGNEFIGGEKGFCSLSGRTPLKYVITQKGKTNLKTKTLTLPKTRPTPANRNKRIYICKWPD